MPWLRLDDAMGEHRKTRRLLRGTPNGLGLAAMGLHALALLHSARYLTDGVVEREFVDEVFDDAGVRGEARKTIVDSLVKFGQWDETEDGWLVHDYLEYNPSRAEVEAKRAADRERKRVAKAKTRAVPHGFHADSARNPNGIHAESERNPRGFHADSTRSPDEFHAESARSLAPAPARAGARARTPSRPIPDQTPPSPPQGGAAGEAGEDGAAVSRRVRFAGREVPQARLALAERLLVAFNEQAGTSYGAYTGSGKPSENLKRILGALTEHPDVPEERWLAAIKRGLARKWWDGKPQTGVVFGPGVVERVLAEAGSGAGQPVSLAERFRRFQERQKAIYGHGGATPVQDTAPTVESPQTAGKAAQTTNLGEGQAA